MYGLFTEYCKTNNIPLASLSAYGLLPNDKGYDVIFRLLLKALTLE